MERKQESECIQVVVRCRPRNKKEITEERAPIITIDSKSRQVSIKNPIEPDQQPKSFTFDATYDETTQQRLFYEESCFSLVENVLEGFNGTIFAYGQTGCGKSWTMQGPNEPADLRGVIPNSFVHIFEHINAFKDIEFLVRCSYLELYNEEIVDLLVDPKNRQKCDLKEDPQKGIFIRGLSDVIVENVHDLQAMLERGANFRTTAATLMNEQSSRSHSIFTVVVEMSTKDETGQDRIRAGKLNLVDLAGSERQKKTGATGAQLKEGTKINLSLSALGNVISSLSDSKSKGGHIPYRDSKLTRLLQDSLGGNTKTLMIAAISPADYNYDETMSTLRYANRAKNITNKPKINEDPKEALLREYKEEIDRLRKLLADQAAGLSVNLDAFGAAPAPVAAPAAAPSVPVKAIEEASVPAAEQAAAQQHHGLPTTTAEGHKIVHINHEKGGDIQDAEVRLEAGSDVMAAMHSVHVGDEEAQKLAALEATEKNEEEEDLGSMGQIWGDVDGAPLPTTEAETPASDTDKLAEVQHGVPEEHLQEVLEGKSKIEQELIDSKSEVERERRMREEMARRLEDLQRKLMGGASQKAIGADDAEKSGEDINANQPIKAADVLGSATAQQAPAGPTDEEKQAAADAFKQRKLKAKKKREARDAELRRIQAEKQQLEDEMEELRRSVDARADSAGDDSGHNATEKGVMLDEVELEKRLSKMKKKYDKKLVAIRSENEELREEFAYQRLNLMETIKEQEKDMKLFEQICRSLLTEKDFKKMVEKSRWNEEEDEWILPYVKRRSLDDLPNFGVVGSSSGMPSVSAERSIGVSGVGYSENGMSSNLSPASRSGVTPRQNNSITSMLPDIHGQTKAAQFEPKVSTGRDNFLDPNGVQSGGSGSSLGNHLVPIEGNGRRGASRAQSRGYSARSSLASRDRRGSRNKDDPNSFSNATSPSFSNGGSTPHMPAIGGSLAGGMVGSASAATVLNEAPHPEKKKKKKRRKEKAIEEGAEGATASEWGFAYSDGDGLDPENDDYDDDNFEEEGKSPRGRARGSQGGSNILPKAKNYGNSLPSVDNLPKQQTSNASKGGFSLPSI